MKSQLGIGARTVVLAIFFLAAWVFPAYGQGPSEQNRSVLDMVREGLTRIGEETTRWLPGPDRKLGDFEVDRQGGQALATREIEQHVQPAGTGPATVSITNDLYGSRIYVSTWDEPLVQVKAALTVYADDENAAREGLEAVSVQVNLVQDNGRDQIMVETIRPDFRRYGGAALVAHYTVYVPRAANVYCDNTWGDTFVEEVGGELTVRARYGRVELYDIYGPVSVRAQGEWQLAARNLRAGGDFILTGTPARFTNVAGRVNIHNFMGSVELHKVPPEGQITVVTDEAPVHVYLDEGALPGVDAVAFDGDIQSDIEVVRKRFANAQYARLDPPNARQRLVLESNFESIHLHRSGATAPPDPNPVETVSFEEELPVHTIDVPQGALLQVDTLTHAVPGDVIIEGVDEDRLTVRATRRVEVQTMVRLEPVMTALERRVTGQSEGYLVQTASASREDMTAMGAANYRVDLVISCPRTSPLLIHGYDGSTTVRGVEGPVELDQRNGAVAIENVKGRVDAFSVAGSVHVSDCAGPVTVKAGGGAVAKRIANRLAIESAGGRIQIEDPLGELHVRAVGGDVKIYESQGIGGNYDVRVERGDISIVFSATAQASLRLVANGGAVSIADKYRIYGDIVGDRYLFSGQLNGGGQRSVFLETDQGDITLF